MTEEKYNYQKINDDRKSGLLLHITSLPGPYGIGTLGDNAKKFIDFLFEAGQSYWQVLPVGPTSYGDSPYQSFSTFAGNPYLIDLDYLRKDGLLNQEDLDQLGHDYDPERVDYSRIYHERFNILRKAFRNFNLNDESFRDFLKKEDFWLQDYALFMAIKDHHEGKSWIEWSDNFKKRDADTIKTFKHEFNDNISFYQFLQFKFYQQWNDLSDYAHFKNIELIGDIPIYVAIDSSDVWANPSLFKLEEDYSPKFVGGCPPDAFSDDGQLWGNPVYDWYENKKTGYKWWIERIRASFKLFDVIRIDHFRGFESYWEIPGKDDTAANGRWVTGPGYELFKAIKEELGDLPIIAEDLGYMTKEVYEFRKQTAFPGMKIIQFAFNEEMNSEHIPHNYTSDFVVYAGTHDNETLGGWLRANEGTEMMNRARAYGNLTHGEGYHWGIIRMAMNSVANTAIFQVQDLLNLGNEARMNEPSTVGTNWTWRLKEFPEGIVLEKLHFYTKNSDRLNKK